MWKELAIAALGMSTGTLMGAWLQSQILKPFIGNDYEINKPKVKGENNLLQVLQSNKSETGKNKETKERRLKLFKRKNK